LIWIDRPANLMEGSMNSKLNNRKPLQNIIRFRNNINKIAHKLTDKRTFYYMLHEHANKNAYT